MDFIKILKIFNRVIIIFLLKQYFDLIHVTVNNIDFIYDVSNDLHLECIDIFSIFRGGMG